MCQQDGQNSVRWKQIVQQGICQTQRLNPHQRVYDGHLLDFILRRDQYVHGLGSLRPNGDDEGLMRL